MRLLEYATVVVGNGHWMKGWQEQDRMSALDIKVFDPCGVGDVPLIESEGADLYDIRPFGIKAGIHRSLTCSEDDDQKWLREITKLAAEPGVGLAACIEAAAGNDTWIGDGNVNEAATIQAGRVLWKTHNVGPPALHLADDKVVTALTSHEILAVGDQMVTAWGDPVVNSPGYKQGAAFWTGPIIVYLSDIDTDMLYNVRNNDGRVIANLVAALDMPPNQIIRIGAVPA